MMTTIDVTQEDIENGMRKSCFRCPIAKAVKREFSGCYVEIGNEHIIIGDYKTRLPADATFFIFDFDHHKSVKPFKFTLDIPPRYLREERK